MNIPTNGQAFHDATENCAGLSKRRHNGLWHYVLPSRSVSIRVLGDHGEFVWKTLNVPVVIPVHRRSERQRQLCALFQDPRVSFLTTRDLLRALRLPYSRRAEIGIDLKTIGALKLRHVRGLTHAGTKIPACAVYCTAFGEGVWEQYRSLDHVRKLYRREAKERPRVCQQWLTAS